MCAIVKTWFNSIVNSIVMKREEEKTTWKSQQNDKKKKQQQQTSWMLNAINLLTHSSKMHIIFHFHISSITFVILKFWKKQKKPNQIVFVFIEIQCAAHVRWFYSRFELNNVNWTPNQTNPITFPVRFARQVNAIVFMRLCFVLFFYLFARDFSSVILCTKDFKVKIN